MIKLDNLELTKEHQSLFDSFNSFILSEDRRVFSKLISRTLLYNEVKDIPGDIVECGVWAGGMSIFLSKLFSTKNIWVCDSYEGCQNPSDGNYHFEYEQHTKGMYAISLETVKDNFIKNNLPDDKRINFLKFTG